VDQRRPNGAVAAFTNGNVPIPNTGLAGYGHLGSTANVVGDKALSVIDTHNMQFHGLIAKTGNGSHPMTMQSSRIEGPNHRFKTEDALMPQPQSAIAHEGGAVPIRADTDEAAVAYMKQAK
jgi:hypothetical protein